MKKIVLLLIFQLSILITTAQTHAPKSDPVFKVSNTPIAVGQCIPNRRMIFLLRGSEDKAKILELIDLCAQYHFTHVGFTCSLGGIKFTTLVNDGRFDFRSNAWSVAELRGLIDRVVSHGMKPFPYIRLLTHQDKLGFGISFPGDHPYMINKATYDPANPELMSIVYDLLDEVISIFTVGGAKPEYLGVGHDEVHGIWPFNNSQWLDYTVDGNYNSDGICNDRILTAAEFETSVMELYNKITLQDSIRMEMYYDVLLQRKEMPHGSRLSGHAGRVEGPDNLFVQIRHRLPRDIIMVDWQGYGLLSGTECDEVCDNRAFEAFDILQNDEKFDVHRLTWPVAEGNITKMKYAVDHILATGNDHSSIDATQFYIPTLESHFEETKTIIRELGTYSYNTVKGPTAVREPEENNASVLLVKNLGTEIDFNIFLPADGGFYLDIYGIEGRKVWSHQAGSAGPGHHSVRWMTSNTHKGVYIAVLRNYNKSPVKKLVIVK